MKVIIKMIALSREHHLSLVLANQCINAVKYKTMLEQEKLRQKVYDNFTKDYETHFLTEERFIFTPLIEQNTNLKIIAIQLTQEHKTLLTLAKNIVINKDLLLEFGLLLKKHTRLEDREVFPYIEQHLNPQQLQKIQHAYD
jgi:hemerythrin-like domain-containing protein